MRLSPAALLLPLAALHAPLLAQSQVDAVVARTMKAFQVPGIAVAIVKDGKVVLSKGYGVRKLGDPAPVTPHTRFGIASNSKIFTAAALAMLVDEGKLAWDDRVVDRLPGFQMSDGFVTREMRIRDLLCHRSGLALGAGDLMFFPSSDLTSKQIVQRLRHIPLSTSFRSAYAYDNILYTVAGEVIEAVSGKPWATFIQERFFAPLGMKESLTSIRDVRPGDDVVAPHAMSDGKLVPIENQPLENSASAGGIVSSVEDMAKWVRTLLAEGDAGNGVRLFSADRWRELRTPLTLLPTGEPPKELAEQRTTLAAYAMGLEVQDYRGHAMVWHTGGLAGMVTRVTLVPDLKLGVVVLTNQESGAAFQAITNAILDEQMGVKGKDWVEAYESLMKKRKERAEAVVAKAASTRKTDTHPSLPLPSYAGRFRDAWYGDVFIEEKDGKLLMRFSHSPALTGEMEHWQYDTFVVRWKDRSMDADAYVTFSLNSEGGIAQIRMKAVSPTTDFSYDFHDLDLRPAPAKAPAY
jgi:CubicO group peptidase (beta-lactamase class C family)